MQIDAKYAKLLFDEATKSKANEQVLEELSLLHEAIFQKPFLAKAVTSPVEKDKIKELLAKICRRFEISNIVTNFMQLLVRLKRLNLLPDIVNEYKRLIDTEEGYKIVEVVSAHKLDKNGRMTVHKMLTKQFGNDISVKYEIDSSIIGGIKASCQSLVLDASVKGAIDRIYCPSS